MKQETPTGTAALIVRGAVILATFVIIGVLTFAAVSHMGASHHTPAAEVRLAAMMAGLFTGGAAASVVLLIFAFGRKRQA